MEKYEDALTNFEKSLSEHRSQDVLKKYNEVHDFALWTSNDHNTWFINCVLILPLTTGKRSKNVYKKSKKKLMLILKYHWKRKLKEMKPSKKVT